MNGGGTYWSMSTGLVRKGLISQLYGLGGASIVKEEITEPRGASGTAINVEEMNEDLDLSSEVGPRQVWRNPR